MMETKLDFHASEEIANADHTLKCDALLRTESVASSRHKVRGKVFLFISLDNGVLNILMH